MTGCQRASLTKICTLCKMRPNSTQPEMGHLNCQYDWISWCCLVFLQGCLQTGHLRKEGGWHGPILMKRGQGKCELSSSIHLPLLPGPGWPDVLATPFCFPCSADYSLKLWPKTSLLFLSQLLSGMLLQQRGNHRPTKLCFDRIIIFVCCGLSVWGEYHKCWDSMKIVTWQGFVLSHDRGLSWTLWSSVSDLPFLMS